MSGWLRLRRLAALVFLLAAPLAGPAPAQTVQPSLDGVLDVVWADPHPGARGGKTRFHLALPDGSRLPLDVAAADRTAAMAQAGRSVTVRGRPIAAADGGARRFAADAITADPAAPARVMTGTRRVLFILTRYKGDTQEPHAPSFYRALTNPRTPNAALGIPATINGFYRAVSWGRLGWRADVVGDGGLAPKGWLTLPRPKTGYAPCGWNGDCADVDLLAADALKLVEGLGIDVTAYDDLAFVINDDLDCCALGGTYTHKGKTYGATWEPPWGQEAGVYVHEFGHAIGLPHSGWVYHDYDSPWDDMSAGAPARLVDCGSYVSANSGKTVQNLLCTEPGAGFITMHKAWLGWLPAANVFVVQQSTDALIDLEADARPLGTGIKMIRICFTGLACAGPEARYLTVETRTRAARYSMGLPGEGVIVHDIRIDRPPIGTTDPCFFNDESGWAVPIDATPGDWRGAPKCDSGGRKAPNYALLNAQFGVGDTYRDPVRGITVSVLAKTAKGYRVNVRTTH